jgi:leucyl aminopeptidase
MALFKLNLKSGEKKISYKPLSVSLKYLVDEKKIGESLRSVERVFNIKISELQRKTFLSKNGLDIRISTFGSKPDEVIILKVKKDENFSADYFRNHLAGFLSTLEKEEVKNLHIFIPKYTIFKSFFDSEEYFYQTFIEGILLGNYTFDIYKSDKKKPKELNVFFYAEDDKKLKSALNKTLNLMEGVYFARDLQNEPAVTLTPEVLAERINSEMKKVGIKAKVFKEDEIKRRKMGGLMAVGMGSDNPPRFIIIEYSGSPKRKKKRIALVGKGVTFDSGGISLKPASNMGQMKADMSGAAVVAGTILAAAKTKLPVDILGVIPAAENMLSGKSMRPGDIVTTSSGKTIEVDDTDAEGRIILADALDYASKQKPDLIIDLATLTGAVVVALGEFVAGVFTKDDKAAEEIYNNGFKTYERVWRLPMWDDYHTLNKSDVADVKNVGGRWGGAITAAKFLENFVDSKIPWVHIDIAGPAMPYKLNNYNKKYMTGFGVRLLFELLSHK